MAKIIGLPRLSPTMEEGTLTRWVKHEGDEVAVDDLIAEVETDKATMEWRAFERGVILKLLAAEGATLAPDAPVAIIGQRGEDITELLKDLPSGSDASPQAAAQSDERSEQRKEAGAQAEEQAAPREHVEAQPEEQREHAEAQPEHAEAQPEQREHAEAQPEQREGTRAQPGAVKTQTPGRRENERARADAQKEAARRAATPVQEGERIVASPSVRRLARERSIDLTHVRGSGPRGRIIQRDLEGLEQTRPQGQLPPSEQVPESPARRSEGRPAPEVVPLSATRRTIARRLTEAKTTIPHYYLTVEVDAEPLHLARLELNRDEGVDAEKLSLNDLVIRACAAAIRRNPAVNVSFRDDAIWTHHVVDIAIAVAVAEGLVTPVIRDADKKGVATIAREVKELAELARNKKLKPEQMSDGTFTISNLGMYGIDAFSAVINPPQAAILAVGAMQDVPVVRQGIVVPGKRMCLTLSCDHRAIDGATGAEWLSQLRTLLEHPIQLLR